MLPTDTVSIMSVYTKISFTRASYLVIDLTHNKYFHQLKYNQLKCNLDVLCVLLPLNTQL